MTRTRTLVLLIVLALVGFVAAQGMMGTQDSTSSHPYGMGHGMMGPNMMGGAMMGSGMMGGSMMGQGMMGGGTMGPGMMNGSMMGSGMMGSMMGGSMMGPGMMGSMMGGMGMMQTLPADATPLADDELVARLEAAVAAYADDARVADVMPFVNHTYAQVVDADGNGLAEILVDRYTGVVMPEPGPNMMWNTFGMMGTGTAPAVRYDESAARERAADFLAEFLPGAEVLAGQAFPGYLTFDYGRDGHVEGMLSVNALSGLVWPHAWHGAYLGDAHD